jgi:DNA replication protein DnaC
MKYKWKFREDFEIKFPVATKIIGYVDTIRDKKPEEKWKDGFYLWGKAGAGKTLLACIFLQELMLKYAQPGKFADLSRQFFQRLKRSYDNADELYGTGGQILDELINVPFLVIDDFGVQRNTEWESEMLYTLIDSRYAEERVTIITSNSDIAEYKKIALGRVYSRILEMCKIEHVDLPDYRETMASKSGFRI